MAFFTLGFFDPHEFSMDPLLFELVLVPLDGILFLRWVNVTTHFGVISKAAEGVLYPSLHVIEEDTMSSSGISDTSAGLVQDH